MSARRSSPAQRWSLPFVRGSPPVRRSLCLAQGVAIVDRRAVFRARHVGGDRQRPPLLYFRYRARLFGIGHHADGFDGRRFDDQRLFGHDKSVALAVRVFKSLLHFRRCADIDQMRCVGPLVAEMGPAQHFDARRRCLGGSALPPLPHRVCRASNSGRPWRRPPASPRPPFPEVRADIREAHAVGGENTGEGVDEHLWSYRSVGDKARVLAAGAAEAVQCISRVTS